MTVLMRLGCLSSSLGSTPTYFEVFGLLICGFTSCYDYDVMMITHVFI